MEYDYLLSDREYLEPSGINPVVNISGVGPMIYANQTAFQRKLSPLNNLHVRDLLITIEIAIEEILQNYLFEFNDVATRQEISSILNSYLDGVRNAGGITSYSVVMNDKNNTPELIGQNFGLVDVEIEPAYGIQKFINRVTLKRTGGALSGGFVSV
jgi:phage tail sheath protein FI